MRTHRTTTIVVHPRNRPPEDSRGVAEAHRGRSRDALALHPPHFLNGLPKAVILAFVGFFYCAAVAPDAAAEWRLVKAKHDPDYAHDDDPGVWAWSEAIAYGTGKGFGGYGYATEPVSAPVDTLSSAVAVGTYYKSYYHIPEPGKKVGEIEYEAEAECEGLVNLIDADCTGVAVGFAELKYIFNGSPVTCRAELTESAASTKEAGSITATFGAKGKFAEAGFSFDITAGAGEGRYSDKDKDIVPWDVRCPVKTFTLQTKNRSQILVWCNEFWGFNADVEVENDGKLGWEYYLLEWPECPGG